MKCNKIPPRPDSVGKFPNTYQIVEMLKVFKQEHTKYNQTLASVGRCGCHWDEYKVSLKKIADYIYEQEGLGL